MNIKQKIEKIKSFGKLRIKPIENDIILVVVFVCIALIAFGLGRLSISNSDKMPVRVENTASALAPSSNLSRSDVDRLGTSDVGTGLLVGSKNSDKYHYPWCPGAQRIKEENKVWFDSIKDAEVAGYVPAGNCKGL